MKTFWKGVTLLLLFLATQTNIAAQCMITNVNLELCVEEVECNNYYSNGAIVDQYKADYLCREFLQRSPYFGQYYLPLNMVYNDNLNLRDEIPRLNENYEGTFLYRLIKSLNISFNNYTVMPKLAEMDELRVLNISHNRITTFKLYTEHRLPKLYEIDVSHNLINLIERNAVLYAFTTLTRLNISHNKITEIRNIFTLTNLQYLDLSHNEISMIDPFSFEGLNNLIYLNLARNKIKEINSSLFRFTKLQILYLNNNELSGIFAVDFRYLNKLRQIDLSYNVITSVEKNSFGNMFELTSVRFKRNLLSYLDPLMFLNTSLNSVDLSMNEIDALPKYMFKGKEISFFDVSQNVLKGELLKGMFQGLSSVIHLDISHQILTSIGDFAFLGLDALEFLNLNNNRIQNVSQNSFNSLGNLNYLDLSNNQISSLNFDLTQMLKILFLSLRGNLINIIPKGQLDSLNRMETLDLSKNNITKMESYSFKDLSELVDFDISENPLSKCLEDNTFKGLNALPTLDISRTSLTTIKNNSFNEMISLHTLNISHSTVDEINFNSFMGTGYINVLDLSYNLLKIFDINSTTIPNLRILYLDHNLIYSILPHAFISFTMIHTISLAHNKLTILDDQTFVGLNNLTILDLSNNKKAIFNSTLIDKLNNIKKLTMSGTFTDLIFDSKLGITDLDMTNCNITNVTHMRLSVLQDLDILTMNHNNIKKLEVGAFVNLHKLNSLDLSYNNMAAIQPGVFKENNNLKTLNISHNKLHSLSYGVFSGLSYLSKLDLSYNELIELKSERFFGIRSLRTLIVDYNKISNIDVEELSLNLSVLSIGGNLIHCDNILKLIKTLGGPLNLTAIKLDDSNSDNIDGISCIGHIESVQKPRSLNGTENILLDIRDILNKLSTENKMSNNAIKINSDEKLPIDLDPLIKSVNQTMSNTAYEINKGTSLSSKDITIFFNESLKNILQEVVHEQSVSNSLLERILKMIVSLKTEQTAQVPILQFNSTNENIEPIITKIRQDLESSITFEKEKILAEVSDKISIVSKKIDDMSKIKPISEKIQTGVEPQTNINSSLFMKICAGTTVTILLSFTVFQLYKHVILSHRQRSYSTQRIADAIENSNL